MVGSEHNIVELGGKSTRNRPSSISKAGTYYVLKGIEAKRARVVSTTVKNGLLAEWLYQPAHARGGGGGGGLLFVVSPPVTITPDGGWNQLSALRCTVWARSHALLIITVGRIQPRRICILSRTYTTLRQIGC